jgi:tRNA U38,U39,U40 pseudouridine synthase TruA
VEDGCSRSCDTICYPGRRLQGQNMKAVEAQWVAAVNDKLPPTVRVLMRYTLTSATADFHAECHFTQQVFEYALPLNAVMPKVGTVIDALAVDTYIRT